MKKFWKLYLQVLIMLIVSAVGFSQNETQNVENTIIASKNSVIKSDKKEEETEEISNIESDSLIHFGDLIDVDVVGSTEYDWRGTITAEGFLDGIEFTEDSIYSLCQTENQVAEEIAQSYSKFLRNPKVVVKILDRSQRPSSTIFGAVKIPQKLLIKRKIFLNELIVLSGGITEQASGEIQILRQFDASCRAKIDKQEFIKTSQNSETENFIKNTQDNSSEFINIKISDLLNGKEEANPQILYGDIISVLIAPPIYVIGGVVNPTKISSREKLTVSRAIATAGGLTKQANPQKITIFRRENGSTKVININLNEIELNKTDDIVLKAYDIVDVSENGRDEYKYPPMIYNEELDLRKNSELPTKIID